jgi:hypothetical protein
MDLVSENGDPVKLLDPKRHPSAAFFNPTDAILELPVID